MKESEVLLNSEKQAHHSMCSQFCCVPVWISFFFFNLNFWSKSLSSLVLSLFNDQIKLELLPWLCPGTAMKSKWNKVTKNCIPKHKWVYLFMHLLYYLYSSLKLINTKITETALNFYFYSFYSKKYIINKFAKYSLI